MNCATKYVINYAMKCVTKNVIIAMWYIFNDISRIETTYDILSEKLDMGL